MAEIEHAPSVADAQPFFDKAAFVVACQTGDMDALDALGIQFGVAKIEPKKLRYISSHIAEWCDFIAIAEVRDPHIIGAPRAAFSLPPPLHTLPT